MLRAMAGARGQPTFAELYTPKLLTVLREGYGAKDLRADVLAAITVAIVALPLSMAIAIASGVTPDRGLYTAIIALAALAGILSTVARNMAEKEQFATLLRASLGDALRRRSGQSQRPDGAWLTRTARGLRPQSHCGT